MIGLVDADLLDHGKTRFPNLALLKISSSLKSAGEDVRLVFEPLEASVCSRIIVSKVFTATTEPEWLRLFGDRVERGGTGYFFDKAPSLPDEVEHARPDYSLYREYAETLDRSKAWTKDFTEAGIGFTTRGCFRRCPFCVNQNKSRVERWSPVAEFDAPDRRFLIMLDDNVLAFPRWKEIFDELEATGKPFFYKQGVDLRLITRDKAEAFQRAKYRGEITVALDRIEDAQLFARKAEIFREYCDKKARCYILAGFYEHGVDAIKSILQRVDVLSRFDFVPYLMRFADCYEDEFGPVFAHLAAWTNQPAFYKKLSAVEFLEKRPNKRAAALIATIKDEEVKRLLNKRFWRSDK